MTEWMYTVDYLLAGALLVMMAIGIAFSAYMPALDKWNKRYFLTLFSLLFLCAVTCLLSLIFYDDPTKAATERVIYIVESLFISVPIFMPTIFLLHCSHEKVKVILPKAAEILPLTAAPSQRPPEITQPLSDAVREEAAAIF